MSPMPGIGRWICTLIALAVLGPSCRNLPGSVVAIKDGDTLFVRSGGQVEQMRISAIDAPEKDQPYGVQAGARLFQLACGPAVTITLDASGRDQYGRLLGKVVANGIDVGGQLVSEGLAWQYTAYSHGGRVAEAEIAARRAKRGLWSDSAPVPPWVWRRAHAVSESPPLICDARAQAAGSVAFRGNVGSRVYHARGCRDYDCPNCVEIFATRGAAEEAGYRPHRACVR